MKYSSALILFALLIDPSTCFGKIESKGLDTLNHMASISMLANSTGSHAGPPKLRADHHRDHGIPLLSKSLLTILSSLGISEAPAIAENHENQIANKLTTLAITITQYHDQYLEMLQSLNKEIRQSLQRLNLMWPHFAGYFNKSHDKEHIQVYREKCLHFDPRDVLTELLNMQERPLMGPRHKEKQGVAHQERLSDFLIEWERSTDLVQYAEQLKARAYLFHLYAVDAALQAVACVVAQNHSESFVVSLTNQVVEDVKALNLSVARAFEERSYIYHLQSQRTGQFMDASFCDNVVRLVDLQSNKNPDGKLWKIEPHDSYFTIINRQTQKLLTLNMTCQHECTFITSNIKPGSELSNNSKWIIEASDLTGDSFTLRTVNTTVNMLKSSRMPLCGQVWQIPGYNVKSISSMSQSNVEECSDEY